MTIKKGSFYNTFNQTLLLFLEIASARFSFIPMRGLRSFSLFRCVCLFISIMTICLIGFLAYQINHYIAYRNFIKQNPFSTVPFWQDNRTRKGNPLLPVLKPEDVYLLNSTIAIGACCRNIRKYLPGFQRNVAAITALFGRYRIYFYESDSGDKSLQSLKEWERNDTEHVRVYSAGTQQYRVPSRTARLATCRNILFQRAYDELKSFDYFLMMDVDIAYFPSFNLSSFLSNFIYPSSSWIAMTATQQSDYYDIWALRIDPVLTYDCWEVISKLNNIFVGFYYLGEKIISIHQKAIPRSFPLIEVQSAFGGAALYNGKYLQRNCSYRGLVGDSWWNRYEICEHVPFHLCLQENAKEQKIYINPQFQIY